MTDQQFRNLLDSFHPISLEEMDSVRLMNRQDTKFVLSHEQLLSILKDISSDYRILEINGQRLLSYSSVYFDENDLSFYRDHHRGKVDRFKVRLRKYLNSNLTFLEVKHKNKGRTDKSRIVVDDIHDNLDQNELEFIHSTGLHFGELEAVLSNSFDRITLVNMDLQERLTIDVNLCFQKDNRIKDLQGIVIAELKQEKISRNSPFYALMKKSMIRPYRISKYCIGVIELLGKENIKYNAFKKKLLRIDKLKQNSNAA